MTLSEFYTRLGSSCEDVLKRIPSEQMIRKFVKMYAADPSFDQLTAAVEKQDWPTAFRAAHTLKGVAQNLGLARLQASASALTEALRGGKALTEPALLEAVRADQAQTLAALGTLDEGAPGSNPDSQEATS